MAIFQDPKDTQLHKIRVIGVGGAGGNAINNMIDSNLKGVDFIVANTDIQALNLSKAHTKIQIGVKLTEGLGAGAIPQKGREAALESAEAIRNILKDSHMVFITAGFGGGTGTGAAVVIAQICKELGILTVAIVTKPFKFEGAKRERQATEGVEELRQIADTVITIPNEKLRSIGSKNAKFIEMFKKADEVLYHAVKGITDLIFMPGHVNLDFADVRTTMKEGGLAIMGIGIAKGENRAIEAAQRAIYHPLLDDLSIAGAKAVLMNITCNEEVSMNEISEASELIHNEAGVDANIIWGNVFDNNVGDEMRITVIATGIGMGQSSNNSSNLGSSNALDKTRNKNLGDNRRISRADLNPPVFMSSNSNNSNNSLNSSNSSVTQISAISAGVNKKKEQGQKNLDDMAVNIRNNKVIASGGSDLDTPTYMRKPPVSPKK